MKEESLGTLNDAPPVDHMGDNANNVRRVSGQVIIDDNEIENCGSFAAQILITQKSDHIELERFAQFSPCQDRGLAA